jgi:signal transduction histidine kinase
VGEKPEVLLVEDDLDIAEILALLFGRERLTVEVVHTLADARAALSRRRAEFDAIVTDKNLPDGSGLSLLAEERAVGGEAEFVVITGYPSLDSVVQALRLGAYDYLEKPFRNLDDVAATVRRAIAHRRLRAERDEARARAVLAERRATLVQVAAGLAHEVKNPLQGIGFACHNLRALLPEGALPPAALADAREQLELIDAESRRLRDLVEGVMDLARPAPRPSWRVLAGSLLRNAAALHATRAQQAGVQLAVDAPEALPLWIDEADVSRALDNQIRNALDVSVHGSTILLSARVQQGRWIALEVADHGPGFPPEARAQAFRPFFTTKARGFGLGLCQVAAAADRAGGRVEVEDNQPTGARVILRLPVHEEGA